MKFLIFILVLIFNLSFAYSKTIIISDLDDTFKISGVNTPWGAAYYMLFTKRAFAGAPETIQALEENLGETYFVSNSPNFISGKIEKLFKANGIDQYVLRTRNIFREKLTYKKNAIIEIIRNHPDDDFILIGDNQERDPQTYEEIKTIFPTKISAIFIHQVSKKLIPAELTGFVTYYEVAVQLYKLGLMSEEQVSFVGRNVYGAKFSNIIPQFSHCPDFKNWSLRTYTADQEYAWSKIRAKVFVNCQK